MTISNAWRSEFVYDGRMRRRIRREYTWSSSAWVKTNEVRCVYEGNLVIQERDINNLPAITYTRGNDLRGTLQGAGGIGGLLARTDHHLLAIGNSGANAYYHADANGNVTALINTGQYLVARYLYDPFGNILSQSGALASANLYQFSSKEAHANSGLTYYLYRFYDPNLQRWPNRDPKGEAGGINLFDFVLNEPIENLDYLGLECCAGQQYDPKTQCCEDGQVVAKVSMWICTRPVNAWYGPIAPGHQDVCCDGAYKNCFGHTKETQRV